MIVLVRSSIADESQSKSGSDITGNLVIVYYSDNSVKADGIITLFPSYPYAFWHTQREKELLLF